MKRLILGAALALLAMNGFSGHHEEGEKKMDADEAAMEAAAMKAMQMAATPGEAHAKLAQSVGKYKAQMQFFMEPGGEPTITEMSVERVMDLDGRVLVDHWTGEVMGAPFEGRSRTGYDNVTQRYWSTWSDNMSTGLLVMYGNWDAEQEATVLEGEGVHPVTGRTYSSRAVSRYPSADTETMDMFEDHGAGEYKTMSISMTRQ